MVPNKDASFYFETYIPNDGVREMFSNVGTMDKLLQAHVKKMVRTTTISCHGQ